MNILIVTDLFFPDVKGGGPRYVNELGAALVKRGHAISVLTRRSNDQALFQEELRGVNIYRYDTNVASRLTFLFSSIRNSCRLFKRLSEKTKFDTIIFNQPLSALGIIFLSRLRNIPKVYIFHSSWPQEYAAKANSRGLVFLLYKFIEKNVLIRSRRIVLLSEFSRRTILDLYKDLSLDIKLVPGGVDLERFKPVLDKEQVRGKLGIAKDKFVLLTVRYLNPRMGLESLIAAMREVVKRYNDVLLIIGGSGPLGDKLAQLVREFDLETWIKLVGSIEDDLLPYYYQAADIFILPTKCLEGFGLATVEALSCGRPVLGTPVGATPEILKPLDEDLLFESIDPKAMSEKIITYINKPKRELDELGIKCRQYVVGNYSWEKVAFKFEEVLNNILKGEP